MSEYQSYLFEKMSENLSSEETKAVDALSSHIEVWGHGAFVEYHYGDFKHDPIRVLEKYFDCVRYYCNWSGGRLAYRFDEDLVRIEELRRFAVDDMISIYERGQSVIVDVRLNREGQDYYPELSVERSGNPFVHFHTQTLNRDYRWLYIMWACAQLCWYNGEGEEDYELGQQAVPMPEGMSMLENEHRLLADFFEVDENIITTLVALAVPDDSGAAFDPDEWIGNLDLRDFRSLAGELLCSPKRAQILLMSKLRESYESGMGLEKKEGRLITVKEISNKASGIQEEKETQSRQRKEKEEIKFAASAKQFDAALWGRVEDVVAEKKIKQYDVAVRIMKALKQAYELTDQLESFFEKTDIIRSYYPKLVGLRSRMDAGELLRDSPPKMANRFFDTVWEQERPKPRELDWGALRL